MTRRRDFLARFVSAIGLAGVRDLKADGSTPGSDGMLNVQAFGARGDDSHDDTLAFHEGIAAAKRQRKRLFVPPGRYRVTDSIELAAKEIDGCLLIGSGRKFTTVRYDGDPERPLLVCRGGSGYVGNCGACNIGLASASGKSSCAVYLDGRCFAEFRSLTIDGFSKGIWLHNASKGVFTEFNSFSDVVLDHCAEGIRLEKGEGEESFHGNRFTNVTIHVRGGEIGLNQLSGYFYNGFLDVTFFGLEQGAVYINADGVTEHSFGTIHYESFAPALLSGSGRFWWSGSFTGIGVVADRTSPRHPQMRVIASSDYWTPEKYGDSSLLAAAPPSANGLLNGAFPLLQRLYGEDVESLLVNVYRSDRENGLFIGASSFGESSSAAKLGFFFDASGRLIRSYHPGGLEVQGPDRQSLLLADADGLRISGDLEARGGYRQTLDGWSLDAVQVGRESSVPRFGLGGSQGIWMAPRAGSLTAMLLRCEQRAQAGKLTGLIRSAGIDLDASCSLTANEQVAVVTFKKDAVPFAAGDPLDVMVAASADWAPADCRVHIVLEVET